MQINLIKYLIRSCPILTSSLRQPDNFWQIELFIHSINFHLDNSFLDKTFIKDRRWNNVNKCLIMTKLGWTLDSLHSDTVCITPDCLVTGGGGKEWWVQGDIYWLPDREWGQWTMDRGWGWQLAPLLHITLVIHIAYCSHWTKCSPGYCALKTKSFPRNVPERC